MRKWCSIRYGWFQGRNRNSGFWYRGSCLPSAWMCCGIFWFHIRFHNSQILSPWEERSEAFTLGVHLILLYFIRISLSTPEIFVLFWWVDGGWWKVGHFFCSLNFFILIIYIAYVYIYSHTNGIVAQQKSYGF